METKILKQPNKPIHPMKDWIKSHSIFLFVVAFVLVGAVVGAVLWPGKDDNSSQKNCTAADPDCYGLMPPPASDQNNNVSGQAFTEVDADLLPIYSGVHWTDPAAKEYDEYATYDTGAAVPQKLSGYEITATADSQPAGLIQYYEPKLKDAGWKADINVAADGPIGSRWGYVKDGKHIIFEYLQDQNGKFAIMVFSEK